MYNSFVSDGELRILCLEFQTFVMRNAGPLRGGVSRGGAAGAHEIRGPQAKRGKKRGCTLSKANKNVCFREYVNDNFV
jgi:hypothetical protein